MQCPAKELLFVVTPKFQVSVSYRNVSHSGCVGGRRDEISRYVHTVWSYDDSHLQTRCDYCGSSLAICLHDEKDWNCMHPNVPHFTLFVCVEDSGKITSGSFTPFGDMMIVASKLGGASCA